MKLDEFLFYGGGALLIETLNVFAELFLKTRMIRFSRDWRACPIITVSSVPTDLTGHEEGKYKPERNDTRRGSIEHIPGVPFVVSACSSCAIPSG